VSLQAQSSLTLDVERIQRATVFIIQAGGEDKLTTRCVSTGTIVRYDGLILTNAHAVVTGRECTGTNLIIAMAVNPSEPPVPKYRAQIAQINLGLDIALLRITSELDGRLIEPENLPILPFVELAPADSIALDETLTIVGYPDIGNSGVQSTLAAVTGSFSEPSSLDAAWIKVNPVDPVPGVTTGGGAYNSAGQLVGIPTTAPVRSQSANCLVLEDTNVDGFINQNDFCVPVGEFITVLRPVSFARPLIRSASLELSVEMISEQMLSLAPQETPAIERVYFATSVNNGLPTRVVGSVPTGTTGLYLFFDYRNFAIDTVYEIRVSVDGIPNQTFSLPPVRWSGKRSGLWFLGSTGQPWVNGVYEFRILVNGLVLASSSITVGGQSDSDPTFSNIVFGILDTENNLRGESYVLPAVQQISARFIYRNLQPDTPWIIRWYYNNNLLAQSQDSWTTDDGTDGSRSDVSIRADTGLLPGTYRLDLYIGSPENARLASTGDFVIAGTQGDILPQVFSPIQFIRTASTLETPSGDPATSFPDGANTVYARFNWQNIAPGTEWSIQWLVDGATFYQQTFQWSLAQSGEDYLIRITAPSGLPDATYTMNILINGVLLQTAQFSVGIGQLGIDRLAQAGGVSLTGQIVDAETNQGIAGATFILISEDYSIADFQWRQDQIYALAVTDRNGYFEIDRPLQFDAPYSVYVISEGYIPITTDGFTITPERLQEIGGSPIVMLIPMIRD
jgi:hypothetical protein